MRTKERLINYLSKNSRGLGVAKRGLLSSLGWTLVLAGFLSGSARGAVDTATVANTSTLLNDSIAAMYVDSASTDTQYWSGHIFAFPSSLTSATTSLGPVSGAAELFNWRQKHNYTQPGADVATNIWLHSIASGGINALLRHVNADGSWEDATLPNTQMALAEISDTYLAIRESMIRPPAKIG